jgi:energy-coupling factor transport system permease protein
LHPLAWWGWAIALGVAVNTTTNPLLLTLIAVAMLVVVLARRSAAPWARSIRAYLVLGAVVIGMRMLFQIVIGAHSGTTVLFVLPEVPLPEWAAGIRLGGAVTAEALVHSGYDALRLAVLLFAVGAANALASPRQALRAVPAALYEVSVAVVVALNVAPQLIESGQRIHRARRLRGESTLSPRAGLELGLAVLGDAIDRSLSLAAGMESRGFARTSRRTAEGGWLLIGSAVAATFGGFLLLSTSDRLTAFAVLALGLGGTAWGLRRAGARLGVTRFRPPTWGWRETLTVAAGVASAVIVLVSANLDNATVFPSTDPLVWPQLPLPLVAAVALVLTPLPLTIASTSVPDARDDHCLRELRPVAEVVR